MNYDVQECIGRSPFLVSACLLGVACRYDGCSKPDMRLCASAARRKFVAVCPECLGGLPIPRTPSERDMTAPSPRVVSRDGEDRTAAFELGAAKVVTIAQEKGCKLAVLKSKSPSCGCHAIYDGSFSGVLVPGKGVTAQRLHEAGVTVIDEHDFAEMV